MSARRKVREYHLICRTTGHSYGGFATLGGAREYVREESLEAWDIFHGNRLVERREFIPDLPAYAPRVSAKRRLQSALRSSCRIGRGRIILTSTSSRWPPL
jgi:hypothetical protein